ncbi:MAG: DUF1398 family protein [Deltaproteobacteria bacterium]|nr:DUF1398 family protein [Deltaproteobacteria bacterium]
MSKAVDNLLEAQKFAMSIRPKVGGFPYLAEALRAAGVSKNFWSLPSCQSIYHTKFGVAVQQGTPLISGAAEIAKFNQEALIRALRTDQAGEGTFPEFLKSSWEAGVISYEVDFEKRQVTYFGALGESYLEKYPAVEIKN